MVSLYLFTGQDSFSKDIKLKSIKKEFFAKDIEDFNLDVLYAADLTLIGLQERLLCLPFKAKKRIIVIKEAQALKAEIKDFLLKYVKKLLNQQLILLILDINRQDPKDEFIKHISRYSKVLRFQESPPLNTFMLSRQIDLKRTDYALRLLSQLLQNGEKPERILGGLRYSWQKNAFRLKLLLNCDIDIKTGRLKPEFALERLVVHLCSLPKEFRVST